MLAAKRLRRRSLSLAVIMSVMPQLAFAGSPSVRQFVDVQLQDGGTLHGALMTAEGTPQADALIGIQGASGTPVVAKTDAQGRFAISGLAGGSYFLTAGDASYGVRAWTAGAAPPTARPSVLLVNGPVTRGNFPLLHNKWFWLIGAAGIAIPLATIDGNS